MGSSAASALNPGVARREVFGWAMYDFPNSGYITVVLTAVFNAYFVSTVAAANAAWATFAWTVALAASAIAPRYRLTWFMEVVPVLIVLPLLAATRPAFPFTLLAYCLIGVHGLILMLGGAYTYAHVPAGR